MDKLTIIISLCLCFSTAYGKNEELDGHSVYQVQVRNLDQVQAVSKIAERLNLDVWQYPLPGREGHVLVPRDLRQAFQRELYEEGITYKVGVQNVKEAVDLEDEVLAAAASTPMNRSHPGLPFDRIHRYEAVDQYLVELGNLYPNVVKVVSGGSTIEGRDIKYLKISTTNFEDTRKPVVMIMSLLHAREWVTLPATLYAIKKLVIDVTDRDLVEDVDWIILPIANPDGYEFSHTTTRFWRKNRAINSILPGACIGVDLNRNFNVFWGGPGSSNSICSETFRGTRPFSEPETQLIEYLVATYGRRMELFCDLHSFGSMILYAYGSRELPPNALTLNLVGVLMAQEIDAVKWPQKRNYIVGNIAAVLYLASGVSSDYVQSTGVPLSYTYELPAYQDIVGTINAFLVDPDFIEQAGFETWQGIKAGVRWVLQHYRSKDLIISKR